MPLLSNIGKKVRWSLAQRGVAGTLRVIGERLTDKSASRRPPPPHPFDLKYGLDTGGIIGGGDLTTGHAHDRFITAYAGISPSRFHATLFRWMSTPPSVPAEMYTFVDIGCGKGRALLLASQLKFSAVVGVELNPGLARIAEANVSRWTAGGHAKSPIRVSQADATEFVVRPGPCLLYLANPFGAPVLHKLLEQLIARRTTDTSPLDILYQNPEQAAVFAEFPAFHLLWSEAIPYSSEDAAADLCYTATDRCNAYRLQ